MFLSLTALEVVVMTFPFRGRERYNSTREIPTPPRFFIDKSFPLFNIHLCEYTTSTATS